MAFTKIFVLLVFAGILVSLGSAMRYLMQDQGGSDRMLKALTWRIGLSVALFASLFIAYALGLIQPHGLTPGG